MNLPQVLLSVLAIMQAAVWFGLLYRNQYIGGWRTVLLAITIVLCIASFTGVKSL